MIFRNSLLLVLMLSLQSCALISKSDVSHVKNDYNRQTASADKCENLFVGLDKSSLLSFESELPSTQPVQLKEFDVTPSTRIEKLYALERISKKSGWDVLSISEYYEKSNQRKKNKILKIVNKISFDEKNKRGDIENVVINLYSLVHSNLLSQYVFKKITKESLIRERVEKAFLKQSMIEALEDLGLVREPYRNSNLLKIYKAYKPVKEWVNMAAINVFSMLAVGVPLYTPRLDLNKNNRLPQEIIDKIKSTGFDSVKEDLRKYVGHGVNFEIAWNTARQFYVKFSMIIAGHFFVKVFPVVKLVASLYLTSPESLQKKADQNFNPNNVRTEQMDSWKQAFKIVHNRDLDIHKYPEDSVEYYQVLNQLKNTPDEDLKVHFK